jgi:hypothetical protein
MSMMQKDVLAGSEESGYGSRISGFYCRVQDFARNISDVLPKDQSLNRIAQSEVNGWQLVVVSESEPIPAPFTPVFCATYRREPHKFFPDLGLFLRSLRAKCIVDMALSESYGSFSLTLLYVQAPSLSDA